MLRGASMRAECASAFPVSVDSGLETTTSMDEAGGDHWPSFACTIRAAEACGCVEEGVSATSFELE